MALIKCSSCGHMVSDKGTKCPKCGTPITKVDATLSEGKENKKVAETESPQDSIVQEIGTPVNTTNNREHQRSKKGIMIIVCAILVVATIVSGFYMWQSKESAYVKYEDDKEPTYSEELVERAKEGDTEAQNDLGRCYYYGYGINIDYDEAVKWYRKAAEQGLAAAQNSMGVCYTEGHGVNQDYDEAVKWYLKAAEQENVKAWNNLGNCYYYGLGINIDYDEAAKCYRKAAEQGLAEAQSNLGTCYYLGNGVPQNYDEAVKWTRKAAEQENVTAWNNLGTCYYWGDGVSQDYNEAVKWYRKAAEQGLARAQYNLGHCYEKGYGIDQNYDEAFNWYQKAAEQGDKEAMQWLAENVAVATADTVGVSMSDEYFMTEAYGLTLYSVENEYGEYASCEYFLYDITMDGVPELWIKVGSCEADYMLLVYTCDNGIKKLYEGSAGHSYFCTGRNYVLQVYGHMGEAYWMKLTYDGSGIVATQVFEENIYGTDKDYKTPEEDEIQLYPSHDKQAIYNMFTAE